MPAFALDLDPDGIRLLHKQDGGWVELDCVLLDEPALPRRLRAMRARAEAMSEGRLETLIVIPPSQILYTQAPVPEGVEIVDRPAVAAALDGLTACPVEEMVFDWRREGDVLRIAALDVNTLDEAETFAATYGFNPVRFTARPGPVAFPADPDFGPTQWAASLPPAEEATPVFSSSRRTAPPAGSPPDAAPAPVPAPPATAAEAPPAETPPAEVPVKAAEAPPEIPAKAPLTAVQAADPAPPPAEVAAKAIEVPAAPPRRPAPAAPAPRPLRLHRPPAPAPRPAAQPLARRGTLAIAAVVLLGLGGLTWTALYLVTPKPQRGLPEVAATPMPQQEETLAEPRLAPRRTAPALPGETGLPPLPGLDGDAALLRQAMAERQAERLLAGVAPDPETEVGVLSAADIWQFPPPPLIEPAGSTSDDIYLAAVDPEISLGDAFALAPPSEDRAALAEPPPPPDPDAVFELDDRGFVVATPEGVLTPDGVVVTAGPPPLRPPLRPVTAVLVPDPQVALALAGKSPRPRPGDLTQRMERSAFGGRTLAELADIRPQPRPASAQQAAATRAADSTPPSALAVAVSRAPSYRPTDFAAIVAAAQQAREAAPETDTAVVAASAAAVAPTRPTIPTSASVARQATIEGAINLRRLNLIGVYGAASDRRALIRLPSGRYIKVKVGDRVDGGQIAAIGDSEIRYVKGGKNHMLKVPSS